MERLLTPDQVCDVLQVTKDWLYDQVQAGNLAAVRLTGKRNGPLRFKESVIEEYIESKVVAG